jgi:cytochrome c553
MALKILQFMNLQSLTLALVLWFWAFSYSVASELLVGESKAKVCTACHGPAGVSIDPAYPILAGQPAQAISIALFQFREGKRKNPLMSPIAANLTNKDLNELAAYFSAQKAPPPKQTMTEEVAAKGKALTLQHACIACHGAKLQGQHQMPRLAAQHRNYLRDQLIAFKDGSRLDMDGTMTSAVQSLAPQDIDILADYISALTGE